MASTPVLGRLAKALLYLQELYHPDDYLLIKREDLANFVNTATETVIRLLSTLKQNKLVNIQGRKIQITDKAGLLKTYAIYQ
ncbi:MAG: CRP-like cAMP-binding protein [Chlamydiales bacterium]|jgi:CRP-like cAMP-binding protein